MPERAERWSTKPDEMLNASQRGAESCLRGQGTASAVCSSQVLFLGRPKPDPNQ
jgi:hypothetical protein